MTRALLLPLAAAFELRNATRLPFAADPVAEARRAAGAFRRGRRTLEFVHAHKCAGTTVNLFVSELMCAGRADDVAAPADHAADAHESCANWWTAVESRDAVDRWGVAPCRVVRPHPADLARVLGWLPGAPRFVSAHEEWSAFHVPWRPATTYKAAVVREPWAWWISAERYKCHCAGAPNWSLEAALATKLAARESQVARNRVAQTVLGEGLARALLHGEGRAADDAAGLLRSYAFLGTVERLDASLCLLGRTFLDTKAACALCCASKRAPRLNAATGACAPHLNASAADRARFDRHHAADRFVYDTASRILSLRLRAADEESWGATPASCGCAFYS